MSEPKTHQIVVRIEESLFDRAIAVARRDASGPPSRLSDVWRAAIALGLEVMEGKGRRL